MMPTTDLFNSTLCQRSRLGQPGYRGGRDGHRGGTGFQLAPPSQSERPTTNPDAGVQEFSIEIPDKDADTIHSGMRDHSLLRFPHQC